MSEADLYPGVEKWVRRHFNCWRTGINTGPKVGRIDVVGVRDIGGDLSGRSEVIAVEVKAGTQVFATAAGQAHGYSVMADRCYLADVRKGSNPFSADEKLIAGHLGIGLVAIRPNGKIDEILTAPPGEPIEELRLQVLDKVGLSLCSLCGVLFERASDGKSAWTGVTRAGVRADLAKAKKDGKGFAWWLESAADKRDSKNRSLIYWRRYLCSDCTHVLG